MLTGSCLCGSVRFRIDGELGPAGYCHCSQCRKASGSAFAANAPVRRKYHSFTRGEGSIREFESSPGKFRAFCCHCGSPLYSRLDAEPETLRIRGPVRIEQGLNDTTVFPNFTQSLVSEIKASVTYKTYKGVDHGRVVTATAPANDATTFVRSRLG